MKQFAKDAEDRDKQSERRIREATQQLRTIDNSVRACCEKQSTLEQQHSLSDQRLQHSVATHGEHLRRVQERCQEMPTMFEDRVRQLHAASQKDVNDSIRRAIEVVMMLHPSNQAW